MSGCTVFVGNLSWSTNEEELQNFAASIGSIKLVQIQRHADTNRSKGWGLIEFATPALAAEAIITLNFSSLNGRRVHLRLDRIEFQKSQSARVFIGNLPWETTSNELLDLFAQFGPEGCNVMTNMTGKSRGFALMFFASATAADAAIAAMNHTEINGRPLECRIDRGPATEPSTRPPQEKKSATEKTSVFVGNLDDSIDSDALHRIFSPCGTIVSATVGGSGAALSTTTESMSGQWGIVKFSSHAEAVSAIRSMNGTTIGLSGRAILVRYDRK